jgi:flagellar biosynthesis/type III secretory pathway protein FliH
MRPFARTLEDFGNPDAGRESEAERKLKAAVAAARGEGHAAGYADGFAAALAQADTEERKVIGCILEAVRDMELARTGARAEAVAALRPLVDALMCMAAPLAAKRGLAEDVAAAIAAHLDAGKAETLVLYVSPERLDDLRHRLDEAVQLAPDPDLGPIAARLEWAGGGALFDVQGCLDAASEAIEAFFDMPHEEGMKDAG